MIQVFWDIMLCGLANSFLLFGGTTLFKTSVTFYQAAEFNIEEDLNICAVLLLPLI
jgi:hypothetical protein